ncbi:sugar transferase [Clostridium sp. D2Q-14]|uniref:sugar transferase n=1 Tax=Anaeromonas gelatinilytica TaxID=2683194 RepID=UPI00193C3D3E|nr:sugar transferase [Anaeromonas gelatinilytica]MBS4536127.1 sugar transferase [Anaeromonas gelatinilytica]
MKLSNIARFHKANKLITIIIDISLVLLGFYLAYLFKFNFDIPKRNIEPFISILPIIALFTVVFFDIYGLLSIRKKAYVETILSLAIALGMISLFTMAVTFIYRGFAFPRMVFMMAYMFQVILLSVWRLLLINIVKKLHGIKKVLIIGKEDNINSIAKKILRNRQWYTISYLYYKEIDNQLYEYINKVDAVIIASEIDYKERQRIIERTQQKNKEVFIVPNLQDMFILNSKIEQFDDVLTFKISNMELSLEQRIVKRLIDILISTIGLIITLPINIIVSILIKIDSKGPILFKQKRITLNNKEFYIYKFRTMVDDAEKLTGPTLSDKEDPRITKVGKFLRSSRIDEIPQLFNVLKGDMSIVGPRPERPYFVEKFAHIDPDYYYRMNVKAGITGLAQILGKYASSFDEKLRFDLIYIRNYSLLLDITIILQTIVVVFMKDKSEGLEEIVLDDILEEIGLDSRSEMGITKIRDERMERKYD